LGNKKANNTQQENVTAGPENSWLAFCARAPGNNNNTHDDITIALISRNSKTPFNTQPKKTRAPRTNQEDRNTEEKAYEAT